MRLVAMVLSATMLGGCVSVKSVVDPTYPKVSYEQVQRRAVPLKLALTTQFHRNGEPLPAADALLRSNVERVLRESGVIATGSGGEDGTIRVVVNNIADRAAAAAKGFGTGLTFGLAGSTVTDAYEMSVTIVVGDKTFSRNAVRHAVHSAIGNAQTPAGLEVMTVQTAVERVFEQMLLRVLREYQTAGSPRDA